MSADHRYQRPGGLPSGPSSGMRPPQRGLPPVIQAASGPAVDGKDPTKTSRAERFEDEKRRIIESCFSKMDEQGHLLESYITHIRVIEDSMYPQSPAPLDSDPKNRKDRVIMVSVRAAGRVRIHKGRENTNHTFSIGKTWNMDDLTAITSFTHLDPQSEEETQWKSWAGDTGFVVRMGKPYYWRANTAKEKEFFIGSIVKIFTKYTKGRVPDLVGFNQREMLQLTSNTGPQRPRDLSGGRAPPTPTPAVRSPAYGQEQLTSPEPLFAKSQTPDSASSRTGSRPSTAQDEHSALVQQRSPSAQGQAMPTGGMFPAPGQLRGPPGRDRELRQPPSREQVRQGFGQDRITPQSSRSDIHSQRGGTPDSLANKGSGPRPPVASQDRPLHQAASDFGQSQEEASLNGLGIYGDRRKPGLATDRPRDKSQSPRRIPDGPPFAQPNGSREAIIEAGTAPIPERRRPPMQGPQLNGSQQSPGLPSPRGPASVGSSSENLVKVSRDIPGGFYPSPSPSDQIERDALIPPPLQTSPKYKQDETKKPEAGPQPPAQPVPKISSESNVQEAPDARSSEATSIGEATGEPKEQASEARPGLGRMFGNNKKTTQDLFKKAATAYNAFVPRAGGAGARMRQLGDETAGDADGISGVFTPAIKRTDTAESAKTSGSIQTTPVDTLTVDGLVSPAGVQPPVPELKVSSPISPVKSPGYDKPEEAPSTDLVPELHKGSSAVSLQKKKKLAEEEAARKRKRRSAQQAQYLSKLGVDMTLFEGRGLEFEDLLSDLDWGTTTSRDKTVDQLELDLRRDIARVEAGSWLEHLGQKDERVEVVEKLLDKAIAEVDEFEGLLTLYSVELSSLNDDIAYIEAQSQGLQVQTANQKLLQSELQQLVETISITPRQLEPLRRSSPGSAEGLHAIEGSLLVLYRAMITIDPNIRQQNDADARRMSVTALANSELSSMTALQQKRDTYLQEAAAFIERLKQFMDVTFGAALMDTKDTLDRRRASAGANTKLSVENHDIGRRALWQFSPLLLFVKEIDMSSWEALLRMYHTRARPIYQDEFRDNVQLWKRLARKPTGDEEQILFTYTEKDSEGLGSTARKLTVKRSQTLARGLRTASNEKTGSQRSNNNNGQPGGLWGFEVLSNALDEMTPLIFTEQNFIVDLFHATGTESLEFPDAVASAPPESRNGVNLFARKMFETDRDMARRVANLMEELFSFFPSELQSLVEWALKPDSLQGIGILHALHRSLASLEDTNQDFLTRTLTTVATRLNGLWTKFVDEQIRAIEETKVKIKKRKGVIAFMKVFPNFSAAIENMLPPASDEPAETSEVRDKVDKSYERINKAMFESLRVIAKESPTAGLQGTQISSVNDPEDKEALNYHILLIENMNHYVEEVDERGDPVLAKGRQDAREDMDEHLRMYVDAVIRRPLGKILDFTESLTHLRDLQPAGSDPKSLATRPSTSKPVFKKLLNSHDSRELRRGIELLRKRVEKHFGDADEPSLSRSLVGTVWKACEERYVDAVKQVVDMASEVFDGEGLPWVDVREIERWFRGGR